MVSLYGNISRAQFPQFIDSLDDSVWCMDAGGTLTYMNQAARLSLGYESEELIGKPVCSVLTPSSAEQVRSLLNKYRTICDAPVMRLNLEFRRNDSSEFGCQVTLHPIRDDNGRLVEFQAVARCNQEETHNAAGRSLVASCAALCARFLSVLASSATERWSGKTAACDLAARRHLWPQ